MLHLHVLWNNSHHWRVISKGVQVPHVAVDQSAYVLHLRAQVLVGSICAQCSNPKKKFKKKKDKLKHCELSVFMCH